MKKIKVDEFVKKGKTIEVFVKIVDIDRYTIFLRANGNDVYADISRVQGVDGYRVSQDAIKKVFNVNVKGDILLSNFNAPKVKEKAENLLREYRETKLKEARKQLTDETEIKLFISTSHSFITVEDIKYADELDEFKKGAKLIKTMKTDDIEKVLGRKHDEIDMGDYSITYKMTYAELKKLIEVAEQKKSEIENKKQEQEEITKKQQEYNKRWAEKNKEHKRYLSYRTTARTFIRKYAKHDDLKELKVMIEKKLKKIE